MLLTLTLIVLGTSIAVFFSQEFIRSFKKLFAIKGVKLFLPLFIASWLVFTFDYWTLWVIYYYHETLEVSLHFLERLMPFTAYAEQVGSILLLTVISVVPVLLLDLFIRRKSYKGYQYPNVTSVIIFIVSAILLLTL